MSETAAYAQRKDVLEKNIRELKQLDDSFQIVSDLLVSLQKKVEHEVMIKFCGSDKILVPATIVNTNEMNVQLGEKIFVKRLAVNALKSTDKRQDMAQTMIKDFESELEQLTKKINYLEQGETTLMPESKQPDTLDEVVETETATRGAIRRTPDGFLEIIERF